jgi:putative SOS response-associated peptidase YedK
VVSQLGWFPPYKRSDDDNVHLCAVDTIDDLTNKSSQKLSKVGKLPPGFELPPDYTIAPSTFQPIIRTYRESGERELAMMRWRLVPAKIADPDSFKIFSTTNARSESILEKASWRGPFTHTRCLVPLDCFYEWLQRPSLPQPPPIEPGEHALFGNIEAVPKKAAKPKLDPDPC